MDSAGIGDIHCHILPGVDDGPQSVKESLGMARCLVAGGVKNVFATSHHIAGTAWAITPEQVHQEIQQLQALFVQEGIPLTLHAGMEIAIHPHLLKEVERNVLLPLGRSDYYLLEPPFHALGQDLLQIVLSFKNTGKNVILAHPERIPFFQKNIRPLLSLAKQGVMMQINLGSLLGMFGKRAKSFSLQLAELDIIHFVASDAHGLTTRTPPAKECWVKLVKLLGAERTTRVCVENPAILY